MQASHLKTSPASPQWHTCSNYHDMAHRPSSSISCAETDLIRKCQRTLDDGTRKDIIEKVRLVCLARGLHGIVELGRAFRRIDDNGYKRLSLEEFIKGLRDNGMETSEDEAVEIFNRFATNYEIFDANGSFTINMTEFLIQLRPPMSESRLHIIGEAFKKLDKTGDGVVTIKDLRSAYCVLRHPLYNSGEESEEEILTRFLANFEVGAIVEGIVTKEEFFNYYAGVSASVDDDTYFDLLMRQTYKL